MSDLTLSPRPGARRSLCAAPLVSLLLATVPGGLGKALAQADLNTAAAPGGLTAAGAALDVHTHIASQTLTDIFTGGGYPAAGADDLVARLDEANVARAVILSGAYFGAPTGLTDDRNVTPENDYVAAEVARYPDRLIGFCGIDPLFPSAVDEIDHCLSLPGMEGVKLHFEASGINLTKPGDVAALTAVFDKAAELDVPVLMHVSDELGGTPDSQRFAALAEILTSHPTVRVTHAHCAGNNDATAIETWLRVRGSGYNPETSWVDVSACLVFFADAPLAQRELLVWQLQKWGIGHVLFGSDYFVHFGQTPREALETLTRYPFTQEELDTILANDGSDWLGR
jgi:predicted TIM-barrel fold metal-dependent hydrolase